MRQHSVVAAVDRTAGWIYLEFLISNSDSMAGKCFISSVSSFQGANCSRNDEDGSAFFKQKNLSGLVEAFWESSGILGILSVFTPVCLSVDRL